MIAQKDWNHSTTQVFWGEIAPCDHVVQIYEDNDTFLDVLAGFVADGISAGDSVIVIATANHLNGLEARLWTLDVPVDALISHDQYIPLDAEESLSRFMVNGWPDEKRFLNFVSTLITRARRKNRKVRAFGEMVALLWAKGHNGATVQLEHLWNMFCQKEAFCLFCAYPKSGFTQDADASIKSICSAHTKIITGGEKSFKELFYRDAASPQL